VLGNYSGDSDFGKFAPHMFDIPSTQKSKMIYQINLLAVAEESIFYQDSPTRVADKEVEIVKISRHEEVRIFSPQIWMLYFDGSKSQS
jgi:hypothetical protein